VVPLVRRSRRRGNGTATVLLPRKLLNTADLSGAGERISEHALERKMLRHRGAQLSGYDPAGATVQATRPSKAQMQTQLT
jgi:hypothetical protein